MALRAHAFEALGTSWTISLPNDADERVLSLVYTRLLQFDQDYSRFRDDSWVSLLAKTPGTYTIPPDGKPLFDLHQELYAITEGAMTPLIGDVLIAAGYDASYSLVPKELHAPYEWDEALEYRYPLLTVKKPTMLDFGAMGKGYAVDLVAEVLRTQSIDAFVINAGGDIYVHDSANVPVRIALENPSNTREAIGTIALVNKSLCGSAGNRRVWSTFTHIIDPDTLKSPTHLLGVWVIAETTLLADALTTALYFATPEKLREHYSFDYLLLRPDHAIERSAGFSADLFLA